MSRVICKIFKPHWTGHRTIRSTTPSTEAGARGLALSWGWGKALGKG